MKSLVWIEGNTSQRQAIIKLRELVEKKQFIQNWRTISLLNVDLKIISKALSEKLIKVLADFCKFLF